MIEYNLLTDAELFIRLKDGDYSAFSEIYQRYGGILFVFIKRRVSDIDDAQDVLQELFVHLWDRREDIDITELLSSHLYSSLRVKMLIFLERNAAQQRYVNVIESFDDNLVITDHLTREKGLAAMIERHVDELPEKMREVFLLSRKLN